MKQIIKDILVPMDGSPNSFRGLDEAISIAKSSNAVITVLFVVPSTLSETRSLIMLLEKALGREYKEFLSKARKKCNKHGVDLIDIIEYGDEGSTIVSFAKKQRFDLIVMGSRGRGGIRRLILGSTANHVLHNTNIPVLIVK